MRKPSRCRTVASVGILAAGCGSFLAKHGKCIGNCLDVCNVFTRFGSAITTTTSICLDYRLQSIRENDISECHHRSATKLGNLCAKNGGLYIKAAQHLSSMDHLLPEPYIEALGRLQDQAPASSLEVIEKVFESELGSRINEIFSDICNVPIGSASIGQVHLARLKSTGEEVAVKVQHPKIKRDSEIDLWTFGFALKLVKLIFPTFDFDWLVEELQNCLNNELNFLNEAANSKTAKKSFDKHGKFSKLVLIPKVFDEFTTERILTMQYISGYKINDIERLKKAGIDLDEVNSLMYETFMEMIFKHQFVHCDPHPGNILVHHDRKSGKVKLVLLDHGIYKEVSPQIVLTFSRLFLALLAQNQRELELIAEELKIAPEIMAEFTKLVQTLSRAYQSKRQIRSVMMNLIKEKDEVTKRQASDTLKSLPRELLFLIKIFDLLRSNERSLTRNNEAKRIVPESLMIITGYSMSAVEGEASVKNSLMVHLKLLEAYARRRGQ